MITNTNGQETWSKLLTENFDIKDQNKLSWVSEYAAIHEIHESALGINATPAGGMNVLPAGQGVGPIYATPLNTMGMGNMTVPSQLPTQNMGIGNPYAPGQLSTTSAKPSDMWTQTPGSGDIPVSTLPMALNIALMTIGFELLPVVPAKGPWQMLSYMDFPYSGGKLGRNNEVAGIDGIGEGRENKPIYVKVLGDLASLEALRKALMQPEGDNATPYKENDEVVITGTAPGRIDDYSVLENEVATEAAEATYPPIPEAVELTPEEAIPEASSVAFVFSDSKVFIFLVQFFLSL